MTLFDYNNYKTYVRERIEAMPKKGRGEYGRIAKVLGISSTVVSQIFNGDRELNADQGLQLALHLGLNELETKYLLTLINKERAGSHDLKTYYDGELKALLTEAMAVQSRIKVFDEISEQHQAQYYSDWIYTGIRMLSAIEGYNNVDEISEYFGLERSKTKRALDFLLRTGLCVEKKGKLNVGPQLIHLSQDAPVINSYRRNWRIKALERINAPTSDDLFYSLVITLTPEDRLAIREALLKAISSILEKAKNSPAEEIACLNLDWFPLKKA